MGKGGLAAPLKEAHAYFKVKGIIHTQINIKYIKVKIWSNFQ